MKLLEVVNDIEKKAAHFSQEPSGGSLFLSFDGELWVVNWRHGDLIHHANTQPRTMRLYVGTYPTFKLVNDELVARQLIKPNALDDMLRESYICWYQSYQHIVIERQARRYSVEMLENLMTHLQSIKPQSIMRAKYHCPTCKVQHNLLVCPVCGRERA